MKRILWGRLKRLWEQRQQVYQDLATFTIDNSGDVQDAIREVLEKLSSFAGAQDDS